MSKLLRTLIIEDSEPDAELEILALHPLKLKIRESRNEEKPFYGRVDRQSLKGSRNRWQEFSLKTRNPSAKK